MPKTLLLADDSVTIQKVVGITFANEDVELVTVDNGDDALARARVLKPDIVLADVSMPGLDGLEVINQLQTLQPELPILVLTMHEEGQYVVRAIQAGAMGYLTKQSAPEQLVTAIRKIHEGQRYITDEAAELLALRVAKGSDDKSPLDSLSMRELQVLRRLAMGQTNREIARSYHISIKTVDTYRARLLKKLGLRNNAELSRFAIQNRLIEP